MLVDTLLTVSRKHYRSKNGLSYRQYGQLSASLCRGRDDTHIKVTVLNTKTRPFSVIATPKVQKYLMEMKRSASGHVSQMWLIEPSHILQEVRSAWRKLKFKYPITK